MDKQELRIAFCWYEPDEWEILKQIAVDKDQLDDTYDDWKRNANSSISELHEQGQKVQKVSIKTEQLVSWCKENELENNSEARSNYAVAKIMRKRT